MSAILTDTEIVEITRPLTQGAARRRYIEREYGVKVKRAPNGQPVVARAEWDARMASSPEAAAKARQAPTSAEPDWKALRAFGSRRLSVV